MNNNLNILTFSTLYPNAADPAFGVFVENRLRHFIADTGARATVIAPVPWFPFRHRLFGKYGKAARVPRQEDRFGIKVYHPRFPVIPKIGMRLTPWFLYRAALKEARRLLAAGESFDLIDAHYLYPDGVAAHRLAERLGLPFVMTARGSDVTQIGLMPGPRKAMVRAVAAAGHVITVSDNLRRDIVGWGVPEDKVTTLRNGVDSDTFREVGRQATRANWGNPDKVILFAGWLIDRKRVDVVIDVAAALTDVTAVIVGDGPQRQALEARARKLGVDRRVRFLGQQPPEAMPKIMSAADVLLLPSEREGWANVLLEAMACGTPVVARAVGSAPDLITSKVAGRVVVGDALSFAKAVQDIFDHPPDRASVRALACAYGWEETSKGQEAIFRSLVKAKV